MNLNYSYRQISCCLECITVSSGCSFLQNLWINEVICMATLLAKAHDGVTAVLTLTSHIFYSDFISLFQLLTASSKIR